MCSFHCCRCLCWFHMRKRIAKCAHFQFMHVCLLSTYGSKLSWCSCLNNFSSKATQWYINWYSSLILATCEGLKCLQTIPHLWFVRHVFLIVSMSDFSILETTLSLGCTCPKSLSFKAAMSSQQSSISIFIYISIINIVESCSIAILCLFGHPQLICHQNYGFPWL